MENFTLYNPVRLHFGKGVANETGDVAKSYGSRALVVYGKGSVMTNGSYDQTTTALRAAGIQIEEYSGIKPNPIIEDVDKAAALGREKGVDMVVAIGGGSVIDSAKIIAVSIPADHSAWEFINGEKRPEKSLPLLAVLTLAATGTEMNPTAVIQNNALQKKVGYRHPLMFPKHSFLDPSFTLSVPANHTAFGIVDLIAHALEAWFGEGESSLSDRFIASIIKEGMEYGSKLMNDLTNYDLRARIMYAATCALNGMTIPGKKYGDWGVHGIGHCLGVLWDLPHGATLSIAYPAWLQLQKERIPERVALLGEALFNTNDTGLTISLLSAFFSHLGSPVSLTEAGLGLSDSDRSRFLEVMRTNKVDGLVHKLDENDHHTLFDLMAK